MNNRYRITFAKLLGEKLLEAVDISAKSVELENGFFTFIGEVAGQDEIVRSVSASMVQEVTLMGPWA